MLTVIVLVGGLCLRRPVPAARVVHSGAAPRRHRRINTGARPAQYTGVWDTDGRTDGRTTDKRACHRRINTGARPAQQTGVRDGRTGGRTDSTTSQAARQPGGRPAEPEGQPVSQPDEWCKAGRMASRTDRRTRRTRRTASRINS